MSYLDEGDGNAIVFVHGTPTWSFLWRHAIRDLRSDFRCIAPDNIGFGLSDKPENWSYSPMNHARNLATLLDDLRVEKAHLVLHGMGGPIGLLYALDHADRVSGITLLNTWAWSLKGDPVSDRINKIVNGPLGMFMYMNINSASKLMAAMFVNRAAFTSELNKAYSGPFADKSNRMGLWKQAKQITDASPIFQDIWERLDELEASRLQLIWGLHDPTFGDRFLNKLWRKFPDAEVHRIPQCGHFPQEERPNEVTHALRGYLTGVPSRTFLA